MLSPRCQSRTIHKSSLPECKMRLWSVGRWVVHQLRECAVAPGHGTGLCGAHSGYNAASQPVSEQLDDREKLWHIKEHERKSKMGKTHEI